LQAFPRFSSVISIGNSGLLLKSMAAYLAVDAFPIVNFWKRTAVTQPTNAAVN